MTISTPDNIAQDDTIIDRTAGGSFLGDSLTLLRFLLAPIVAAVILIGWPETGYAVLASFLFACGALTDLFDDMIGGPKRAGARMFGWFDDVADSVLIALALLAMIYVIYKGGYLSWTLVLPAALYIGRDIFIGLTKGYELRRYGAPQSRLGDWKNALAMLGVSLMIASPWLQQLINRLMGGDNGEKLMEIYSSSSPWVWVTGFAIFNLSVILSLYTGLKLLKTPLGEPAK